jgi:hypothetical protein
MASIGIGGVGQQLDLRNEQDDLRREAESVRLVQEIIGGINNYANLDRSERIMQVQESQEQRSARKYEDEQIAALAQSALIDEQRAQAQRDADNVAAIVSAKKANAEAMGEAERVVADANTANAEMTEKLELLRPVFGDDWVDAEIQKRAPSMSIEGAKITSPVVVQPPNDLELANEKLLGDFPIETHIRGSKPIPLQAVPNRLTGEDLDPRNGAVARLAEMARKSGLNPDLVSEGLSKASIDSAMAAERAAAIARKDAEAKAELAAQRAKAEMEKWGYGNQLTQARVGTEGADQKLKLAQAKAAEARAVEHLAKAGAANRRYRRVPGQTYSKATTEVLEKFNTGRAPPDFVRAQQSLTRTLGEARKTFKNYTKSVEAARNAGSLLTGKAVEDAVRGEIASSYLAANEVMKSIEPAARYKLMGLNALQISEGDVANHMSNVVRQRMQESGGKFSPAEVMDGVVRETNVSLMEFGRQLEKAAQGGFKKMPKKPAFWTGPGTAHQAVELDRERGVVRATDREVQERAREGAGPRRNDLKEAARQWSESWKAAYSVANDGMRDGLNELKEQTRKKLAAFEAAEFPDETARNAALQQLHSELLAALPEFDQYIKTTKLPTAPRLTPPVGGVVGGKPVIVPTAPRLTPPVGGVVGGAPVMVPSNLREAAFSEE